MSESTELILNVTNLEKSYVSPDGERRSIVRIPTFSLKRGEQFALRGASGSGKTTFLNCIAGILQADAGTVIVDGEDMTAYSETRRDDLRARTIGYVFQTFNLLHGYTALENVLLGMMFGGKADAAIARQLLGRVGLGDRLDYRPRQLSVGQQQRVAVARALAHRPTLVLADEPTGNLDRRHGREALTLIREICTEHGAALLLVSHDIEVLGAFGSSADLATLNLAASEDAVADSIRASA